jgi:hypothetical protein
VATIVYLVVVQLVLSIDYLDAIVCLRIISLKRTLGSSRGNYSGILLCAVKAVAAHALSLGALNSQLVHFREPVWSLMKPSLLP